MHHPKIPMSKATEQRLIQLAERISDRNRKVSEMQLAASSWRTPSLGSRSEPERTLRCLPGPDRRCYYRRRA